MRKLLATTALLTAAVTANAAIWEVTPTEHLLGRDGDAPSAQQINPAPSAHASWGGADTGDIPMPTCTYNDATQVLSCTGVLHIRSQISPLFTSRLFDRYITDLNIDAATGDPSGTAAYVCENTSVTGQKAGGFGEGVGANMCGNYLIGANFTDDSTLTYGPGLAFERTLGGDDSEAGAVQTIADYALTVASFTPGPGGTLVLQSADWDPESSAGTQLTFEVGEESAGPPAVNNDTAGVLEGSADNEIDVLANDTNLPEIVTVEIDTDGLSAGSSAVVQPDNTILYTPDPALTAGEEEVIPYIVLDAEENEVGSAVLTITIEEDVEPVAPNGDISISSQNGATTAGTVNVAGLDGYSAGNAPATVAIATNSADGNCTVNGTTISFTRNADFVAGDDTTTCTYTVTDNDGDVSEGTITISINDVQPAVNDGSATGEVDGGALVATGSFTAGNGSAAQHAVEVTDGDCTAEISGGNVLVTYEDDSTVGEFSCQVTVTDADEDEDTATFTFTVTEAVVNRPRLPGGGGAMDLWSLMLLGGLPLLGLRRRRS